ncbi:MAG: AMP-binding protein, partial [Pseudomonadales bacterium]|nr:AMP-binding protein [Pseudomonadales bacterium]
MPAKNTSGPTSLSYRCGTATTPLRYQTIGDCLTETARHHGDNDALIVPWQNIHWNYTTFNAEVNRFASGLLALGVEAGDRVGIWAPNCYEWVVTQFATARIGAIMVCINPAYRLFELEYALNKSGCQVLVTAESFKTSHYLGMLQTLVPELQDATPGALSAAKLPNINTIIRMGAEHTPGMLNFDAVCQQAPVSDEMLARRSAQLQPDDAINIQFTSGTTGSPKGATLSHFNILNNASQVAAGMNFTAQDRLCIPVPLYHCFGMVMGTLACVSTGATMVFPAPAFEAAATMQTVQDQKCTALHGVPTMFVNELELPDFASYDLSSLRTGIMAGAPCPEPVMRRVINEMHMSEVTIMYGQTETSPVNHMTGIHDPIDKRVGTVGRAGPYVEIKIIGEQGELLPLGEKGELCCRGYPVMKGYWDDEEQTAATIDSAGWLHSGDLAVMDAEGYVQIVGRIKDMIIRGGENVYPREVEEFLYTHPDIQEVQVFGVPHEIYGEEVCAWIRLRPGSLLDAGQIRDFCRDQITHFKIPTHIDLVDDFPMTVTGKIQKFK